MKKLPGDSKGLVGALTSQGGNAMFCPWSLTCRVNRVHPRPMEEENQSVASWLDVELALSYPGNKGHLLGSGYMDSSLMKKNS